MNSRNTGSSIRAIEGNLTELADALPLSTPYSTTISVGNTCNFRCVYCGQYNRDPSLYKLMKMEEFEYIARQIEEFDQPLRQVTFVSSGETMLNRNLPEMIHIIKTRGLADRVKIITNGSLLSPEYSDKLIEAGLDAIKISLQGITTEAYKKTCGIAIDYDVFLGKIKYLYEHRGQCEIHVKVIDIALAPGEDKQFYEMYGSISDTMFIEHCVTEGVTTDNKYFQDVEDARYCPMSFYSFFIDEHLDVFPCCLVNRDVATSEQIMGNIKDISLKDLWETKFKALWLDILKSQIPTESICSGCIRYKGFIREADIIDQAVDSITGRMTI